MENKIWDILENVRQGYITVNDGTQQVLDLFAVSGSTLIREHCPFKLKPCNYTGRGWYDRCAWCKDNNGFIRPKEDSSKPF